MIALIGSKKILATITSSIYISKAIKLLLNDFKNKLLHYRLIKTITNERGGKISIPLLTWLFKSI